MKKVRLTVDKKGNVKVVEDPNGEWRLAELPHGGTALLSPLSNPDNFTIGIDAYTEDKDTLVQKIKKNMFDHRWDERPFYRPTPQRPLRKLPMELKVIDSRNQVFSYRIENGKPQYLPLYYLTVEK